MKIIAINLQDDFGGLLEFSSDAFESLYMKGDLATLTLKSGAQFQVAKHHVQMLREWLSPEEWINEPEPDDPAYRLTAHEAVLLRLLEREASAISATELITQSG